MTDLIDRLMAFDVDGKVQRWTPEIVASRMIEAAAVVSRIPVRIGPSRLKSVWPVFVRTAEDLVDEQTRERLMRFPHLVGDWQARIDPATQRHMSREKQLEYERSPEAVGGAELSRAEEALLWPARYLGDRPLLADALTLWAFCIGTKASLRATLRSRAERADDMVRKAATHDRGLAREAKRRTGLLFPPPKKPTRQDVMPGVNFDRGLLNERRKTAAAAICAALSAANVLVREPKIDIQDDPVD